MVREQPVVDQAPSPAIGKEASDQNDEERVVAPNVVEESADYQNGECHRNINLGAVLQTYSHLNYTNLTKAVIIPIDTHVRPLVNLYTPGFVL